MSIHEEQQLTFDAAIRALTLPRGRARTSQLTRKLLNYLWNHRDDAGRLIPTAVAAAVYSDLIDQECRQKPSLHREDITRTFVGRLRVAITDLRNQLKLFFETDAGRRLPFVVTIGDVVYQLQFSSSNRSLKVFWWPLCDGELCHVISAAPLFFRYSERRLFLRLQDLNRERNVVRLSRKPARMRALIPSSPIFEGLVSESTRLRPCRPYTTLGETKSIIAMSTCFRSLGIPCRFGFAHEYEGQKLSGNLVLLGNVRTNPLLLRFPKRLVSIRQRPKSIVVAGRSGEAVFRDDLKPKGVAYGLITRFSTFPESGKGIISLAGHYSLVISELAEIVTDNERLSTLREQAGFSRDQELPANLEVLVEFRLDAKEQIARWHVVEAFPEPSSV